jgi:hypothetical protein
MDITKNIPNKFRVKPECSASPEFALAPLGNSAGFRNRFLACAGRARVGAVFLALVLLAASACPLCAKDKNSENQPAKVEPSFETTLDLVRKEHVAIENLMQGVRFHTYTPDAKFQEFLKAYRRGADVVETAQLGFLRDPNQSAADFMEKALQKDAWKKPMDTPLSFILLLSLRTAHDRVRLTYARLHNRTLDLEVDQLCPVAAPELEHQVLAVIEIPLGQLSPGPFFYMTSLNAGQHRQAPAAHPEGWEYADVSSLRHSSGGTGASGCTIVDPATKNVPPTEKPPVRKSRYLSEARLNTLVDRLQRTEFPIPAVKFFETIGFSKEEANRPDMGGWSAERGEEQTFTLTEPPVVHRLKIHVDKTRTNVLDASIYYLDDPRKYTLFDSRAGSSE